MVLSFGTLKLELFEFQDIIDCVAEFYLEKNQNNNYKS